MKKAVKKIKKVKKAAKTAKKVKTKKVKKVKPLGKVTHWYDNINVAVVRLTGSMKTGDKVKIKRGEEEFEEIIESMQLNHEPIKAGKKGQEIAIKLIGKTKDGAEVFLCE